MRARWLLVLLFLVPAPLRGEEETPSVSVERAREILESARPHLVRVTGRKWPEGLEVVRTDRAGLTALLLEEFQEEIDALHPGRSPASRRHLARVLATSFSRVVRAKYGLKTKKIHVAPGALARLPEGTDPDDVLVHLVTHEAVHALDDGAADLAKLIGGTKDREALRALRMVIEGRAEHYGAIVAAHLGAPEEALAALVAGRDLGERLTREAGRAFVAALAREGKDLPLRALREPPRSTSTVFHPERYSKPVPAPDLARPLAASGVTGPTSDLSELLLRRRFLDRLDQAAVEKAFSGYLAGATVGPPGGRHVSLLALESPEAAEKLLAGMRAFEGVAAGAAKAEIRAPDGHRFVWGVAARGRFLAESVVPGDEDPRALLEKVLDAAAPE